ncbi:MAG: hypothetical protein KJZ93_14595 [Caldilineaceae bacterium]|nr:hypothetical protein [Caldilineaceae bacterium]
MQAFYGLAFALALLLLHTPTSVALPNEIEWMATDDHGNSQGFDPLGMWSVGPFELHLPTVARR